MTNRILGIESSCDETAAAVVADGSTILSNVVASQMDIHQKYGGVVPELASRQHLRSIVPVVREALERAGMGLADVDAIGVTQGPGLVGSLLVGLTYGKVLALALNKPLVAVNHIEGHVHAVFLEARQALRESRDQKDANREIGVPGDREPAGSRRYEEDGGQALDSTGGQAGRESRDREGANREIGVPGNINPAGRGPKLPAVCLIVSGGHTVLYEVSAERAGAAPAGTVLRYRHLGQTRDDAAGEAYDKVARLLALGYPGGPIIDQLAASAGSAGSGPAGPSAALRMKSRRDPEDSAGNRRSADADTIRFGDVKIKGSPFDFSFSGIKTAVLYYLRKHPEFEPEILARREALARGERKAAQLLPLCSSQTLALLVSFQRTVVHELVGRTLKAARETGAESVLVSGGVAANGELRATFEREASKKGIEVFFPSRELSTDNAAMIAAAAYPKLLQGDLQGAALNAEAVLPLA
jgi:N6-L-threonylcarbamoyladenine synthase